MASPSSILLLRLMTVGEAVNLWGGYLNTALETLERASKGYQSIAVTGDATISWTQYSAANSGSVARLKLTGTLSSAATLTFPSYQNFLSVDNSTGAQVTIKCSGGTGVAIANGGKAFLYCDGVDYFNAGANLLGSGTVVASGRITGVTAGTAATDAVNKTQMETAIATAGLPATAGTVLVDSADTTAGYIGTKIVGSGDINVATSGTPGNGSLVISADAYWSAPVYIDNTDSPYAASDRDYIFVDTSGGTVEIDLPVSGRVWIADQSGDAATNNITVDPAGTDTTSVGTIDLNYFSAVFVRNASGNWDIS